MKRLLLVCTLTLGLSGCEVWNNIYHSREKARCRSIYSVMKEESRNAIQSTGLEKIAHLQAVEINTQLLMRDRCCRWSDTCLVGIWLSRHMGRVVSPFLSQKMFSHFTYKSASFPQGLRMNPSSFQNCNTF